jgi:D-erythrulose 1-phosphate 3-epimerase
VSPQTPTFTLGINTGFAVNRFAEPEEWVRIVGDALDLRYVQLTADMLNPDLGTAICQSQSKKILAACQRYDVEITSTFTGGFTRVNHLAHPDPNIRKHWLNWFKRYVDISVDLGARSMGSHFGIFTHRDDKDITARAERRQQNIEAWHEIGAYARQRGLDYLSWEPMSISREQGETIDKAHELQRDVNLGAPIDFRICLDVDHGDVSSTNRDDTDPYKWLSEFAQNAPLVHLKQSSANKGGHWPFTSEHNKNGRIDPQKVLNTLEASGASKTELLLELSFREREPADSTVVNVLQESVAFWRPHVPL